MEKTTKTVWEIIILIGLLVGSYCMGKNSKNESAPVKMQIVQPVQDSGKGV